MTALSRARMLAGMWGVPATVLLTWDTPGGPVDGLEEELRKSYGHIGSVGVRQPATIECWRGPWTSTWAHRATDPGAT